MSDVDEMMPAFHDELTKVARAGLGRRVLQGAGLGGARAAGFGSGVGTGAMLGAGGGAAIEGTRAYQEARAVGASHGQASAHALGRGLGGAAKGGLVGAGLGGAVGALKPSAVAGIAGRDKGSMGAAARFGQRQVHALTGWTPKGGIESIRGGAWAAKKRVKGLEKGLAGAKPGVRKKMESELAKARTGEQAAIKAQEMGLTSLPGYGKSLLKKPGETVRAGVKEQWQTSGPLGRSLIFGFPAATIGGELARPSRPGEEGRFTRAGKNIGDLAYSMGPVPIAGQMALGTALSAAGGQTGKILSKKKKQRSNAHIPAPPQLDPAGGDAVAGESIVSERAMGGGGGIT